ncbi:hypothetical protein MIND_00057300 [Mycena indigotica]|uniref:Uncharacterized protein n=1 Tax=Mycena indigotica TaxID=2126181 RepID=A0A8H6TAY4_9AGAR|nr:uncharacterized protein MIND_00057300 [Mycena indigotica]KAF7315425.1 hypothetical protein MIND_00057300 [Mycena indigotica]
MSSLTLNTLPRDLLLEISAVLDCRHDLRSLAITSKALFINVAPVLYQTVVLKSVEQTTVTLAMLQRHLDIAHHVRELTISPSRSNFTDSKAASAAVASIAFSKSLESLAKFSWYDDYLHEEMWLALRMCCPRLRYLSTSVGAFFPPNSQLFNFTDLHGFSLHLGPGFYNSAQALIPDEGWPPSKKLWDMLFTRCPNLQELSIEGYSAFPADAHCIIEGRWPHLQRLTLGDLSVDWSPANSEQKGPFVAFLEAHPELQSLSLSRHNVDPVHLHSIDHDTLKLTSFSGTLHQLQGLSRSFSTLRSLTFRDPLWSRDPTILAIATVLTQLTALTDLSIIFTLHSPYDSSSILRALVASCPQIQNLTLACLRKTSFQLDTLAKALSAFRRLQTLNATLVSSGDLSLAAAGTRFARANPRLREFCIAFVPPSYPHGLPYRPLYPFPRIKRATARFEVICDDYDLPKTLRVRESSTKIWPWMLRVVRSVQRYDLEVRWQSGGGGRRQDTNAGLIGMLMETSPAGEELRVFAFCSLLVCFAGMFLAKS